MWLIIKHQERLYINTIVSPRDIQRAKNNYSFNHELGAKGIER